MRNGIFLAHVWDWFGILRQTLRYDGCTHVIFVSRPTVGPGKARWVYTVVTGPTTILFMVGHDARSLGGFQVVKVSGSGSGWPWRAAEGK